ncbi:pyridoxamine 5'-phosphate oxidase family protein [Pelagicoccus albus]|uniref:Pyridoxamine 5'-phosphate oxidase family protein n=1 Tax=Pelagicoccus albus TaxID=415222 RepID=A0A7X1B9B1_9BACT|nr:pyridoxamine 5'-phosphate oxidase family protein [Pelagicoccus albus]MBC2607936.1 pyridoxamine 5'-phosphate oxidase family protein [Pelagicoccus albus]
MSLSLLDELILEFQSAKDASEPNAFLGSLATCDSSGQARVRTVVIHELTAKGLLLVASEFHQKWRQLSANPKAEIMLWWPSLGLQYRITGKCISQSPDVASARWSQLPPSVRRLDLAYGDGFIPGQAIESIEKVSETVAERSEGKSIETTPSHVRAILFEPEEIERLKTSPSDRQHDRRRATLIDGQWHCQQLVP